MAIKASRPAWYLVGGTLYSPDGSVEIRIQDEKLSKLPNLIIRDPSFPAILEKSDSLEYIPGKLTAKKKGKYITTIEDVGVTQRIPTKIQTMFQNSNKSLAAHRGIDATEVYKYALKANLPATAHLESANRKVSCILDNVLIVGVGAHIDFVDLSKANISCPTDFMWVHIEQLAPYFNQQMLKSIKVRQEINGLEDEITVNYESTILRTLIHNQGRDLAEKAIAKYREPYGDIVMELPKEAYDELKKHLKKVSYVTLGEDGVLTATESLYTQPIRFEATEGIKTTGKKLKIPGEAFRYPIEKDDKFYIYYDYTSPVPMFTFVSGPIVAKSAAWSK